MAKNIANHLRTAAKPHPKIGTWHRFIVNHFWFSCKISEGYPDLAVEMFHSCLFHVANIHNWKFRRTIHDTIEELTLINQYWLKSAGIQRYQKKMTWFNTEDEDYLALFKIVTATSFSNALRKCAKFLHTGKLDFGVTSQHEVVVFAKATQF